MKRNYSKRKKRNYSKHKYSKRKYSKKRKTVRNNKTVRKNRTKINYNKKFYQKGGTDPQQILITGSDYGPDNDWLGNPILYYNITITTASGEEINISRRYSQFVELNKKLEDSGLMVPYVQATLPPKLGPATRFELVGERLLQAREEALQVYLNEVKEMGSMSWEFLQTLPFFMSEDTITSSPTPGAIEGSGLARQRSHPITSSERQSADHGEGSPIFDYLGSPPAEAKEAALLPAGIDTSVEMSTGVPWELEPESERLPVGCHPKNTTESAKEVQEKRQWTDLGGSLLHPQIDPTGELDYCINVCETDNITTLQIKTWNETTRPEDGLYLYNVSLRNPNEIKYYEFDQERPICGDTEILRIVNHNCLIDNETSIIAGLMVVKGNTVYLNNGSGHYRPDEECLTHVTDLITTFGYTPQVVRGYGLAMFKKLQLGDIADFDASGMGGLDEWGAHEQSQGIKDLAALAAAQKEIDLADLRRSRKGDDLPEEEVQSGAWVPGDDY
jgi:hypothetical protein